MEEDQVRRYLTLATITGVDLQTSSVMLGAGSDRGILMGQYWQKKGTAGTCTLKIEKPEPGRARAAIVSFEAHGKRKLPETALGEVLKPGGVVVRMDTMKPLPCGTAEQASFTPTLP